MKPFQNANTAMSRSDAEAAPIAEHSLEIAPEPTADEVAAIVAALSLLFPDASARPGRQVASSWRFSGRHWSAPAGWGRRQY